MSDGTSQSPTEEGDPASPETPQQAETEIPVGDMSEEGQTEVGPVAKDNTEAQSSQE